MRNSADNGTTFFQFVARASVRLGLIVGAVIAGAPPTAANAAPLTTPFSMIMLDLPGSTGAPSPDEPAPVRPNIFSTVTASGTANSITITNGTLFPNAVGISLTFAPAVGKPPLAVGTYENATYLGDATHPKLQIISPGIGAAPARFIIDEITTNGAGTILTFSARFTLISNPAGDFNLFGFASYNATAPARVYRYGTRVLNTAPTASGASSTTPLVITNIGPGDFTMSAATISGVHSSAFRVVGNDCQNIHAGSTCRVLVQFNAAGGIGERTATLEMHHDLAPLGGTARVMQITATVVLPEGEFTAITPARILDTRNGTGGYSRPVGAHQAIDVAVIGVGDVPSTGVSSVVFNLTAVKASAQTFLTVWPTGLPQATLSNLNLKAGETRANLVTVAVGTGGKVRVYNDLGNTNVIFDIVGFYSSATGPSGARFHADTPRRVLDTRDGTGGAPYPKEGSGTVLTLDLFGLGMAAGQPTLKAAVFNVTVTGATGPGWVTVYPGDVPAPTASNLNYVAGQTVPNLVTVRVPADLKVKFQSFGSSTHIIVDLVGYYDLNRVGESGRFISVTPSRMYDTRNERQSLEPDSAYFFQMTGLAEIPATAGSVVLNVTALALTDTGYLTVFPDSDCTIPRASNLNFVKDDVVPNLVIVGLSQQFPAPCTSGLGRIDLYNSDGYTDVIIDVFGYFTA
jgi:hypothetical protein